MRSPTCAGTQHAQRALGRNRRGRFMLPVAAARAGHTDVCDPTGRPTPALLTPTPGHLDPNSGPFWISNHPRRPDIVSLLSAHDNVKLVLSGHYHKVESPAKHPTCSGWLQGSPQRPAGSHKQLGCLRALAAVLQAFLLQLADALASQKAHCRMRPFLTICLPG